MKKILTVYAAIALILGSCSKDDSTPEPTPTPDPVATSAYDRLIVCNEGNWQSDNGQLSFYDGETSTLTNQWFRSINGIKLGDTPNDIIQVNDTLIAIAVNWSNIIQYIHPDGTACGATENVPNNRRMCSDGRYIYITSYAHRCGSQTFEKGYVAKVDVATKEVVAACETGWEPEAVQLYKGRLYVANTGGYAFSENHDYETTISVIDAEKMQPVKTIDTGKINLYGDMSQAGQYLCVNSPGDYYNTGAATVIVDCETDQCTAFDFPCTYNTTDGRVFYTVGSAFSYNTGGYEYYAKTIDPATMSVTDGVFCQAITDKLKEIVSPYALYLSPYTGFVYFTDARSYATAGYLYGYQQDGTPLFEKQKVHINPSHLLVIKP